MVIDLTKLNEHEVVVFGDNKCIIENAKCIPVEAKYICMTNKEEKNPTDLQELSYTTDVRKLKNPLLILFSYDKMKMAEWILYCNNNNFSYFFYPFLEDKLLYRKNGINCKIFEEYDVDEYIDRYKNHIVFDKSCTTMQNIMVMIRYNNLAGNYLRIGNIKAKGVLYVEFLGSNGQIVLKDNSTFESVIIQNGMNGIIEIGEDCMFSVEIELRQTDAHHIFDLESGERINRGKNINIGRHVWCGRAVKILGGFSIDDNSIIGAGTVSSGHFGKNLIIAGSPARVIRENIIWSRDGLDAYDWDSFIECRDKTAMKYLDELPEYMNK